MPDESDRLSATEDAWIREGPVQGRMYRESARPQDGGGNINQISLGAFLFLYKKSSIVKGKRPSLPSQSDYEII